LFSVRALFFLLMTHEIHEAHRVMMQILWSHQILSEPRLNEILQKILAHYQMEPITLEMFLRTINKTIEFMGFEIRKIIGEEDGIAYWGIANIKSDDFAKGATALNAEQLNLFQLIIRKIVEEDSGELSKTELINARLEITERQISAQKAEETIDYLIETKWLRANNDKICLGPRTFLELKEYIEKTFSDIINECLLCQEPVVKVRLLSLS